MMKKLSDLTDVELAKLITNRRQSTETLWSKIKQRHDRNLKIWQNDNPELSKISEKKSKTRIPRLWMAVETINNFLTGRPGQPLVIAGNESDAGRELAANLQDVFLEKNRTAETKKKLKRALRNLYFSRLFCLKVCWDPQKNDFAIKNLDPRKVRLAKNASNEGDSSFVIEDVSEPIMDLLGRFPEAKHAEILAAAKMQDQAESAIIENKDVEYQECWIEGDGASIVAHYMGGTVFSRIDNPYFDYTGVKLSRKEASELMKLSGKERRRILHKAKMREVAADEGAAEAPTEEMPGTAAGEPVQPAAVPQREEMTETVFFNHFERPRKPYIFGTIFDTEETPVGETDMFDQANPLQENVDERARQISDNARLMNGIWLVDQAKTGLTKNDAAMIQAETAGFIVAPNATEGVKRDTGKELPVFIVKDLLNSMQQIDEILGTPDTFRGAAQRQETAQGRLILREQAVGRLDELITLVDYVYRELYDWELQLMKSRYTETHYAKIIGSDRSVRTVELLQDDIDDGIEVRIIPGQTLPEDRVYRLTKAQDAMEKNIISPVRYLEESGWDNPQEAAKEGFMYQQNPLAVLKFTDDELNQMATPAAGPGGGEGGKPGADRAEQLARARDQLESPEFSALPPEEQARIADEIERVFPELRGDLQKLNL